MAVIQISKKKREFSPRFFTQQIRSYILIEHLHH
jgi:hypothetical protein